MRLDFNISDDVDITNERAIEIYDEYFHKLISDLDSSGGLLVGDDSSVLSKLKEQNTDYSFVYDGVKETNSILNETSVEEIEKASSLFREFVEGKTSKSEVLDITSSFADTLERAEEEFRENVYNKINNTKDTNVGYTMSYIEEMKRKAKELEGILHGI